MSLLYGRVAAVETVNLGESVMVAASIGATTLNLADASTFDELGGLVSINGELLAYTSVNVDTNVMTLSAALTAAVAEQDMVYVQPETPIKTATVELPGEGDSIPATVLHSLLDKLPDGIRSEDTGESVVLEQRGSFEYVVTDVVAEPLTQTSLDYIEGEQGYGLGDAIAQMQDAQVTGQLGAAVVSTDQVILDGTDLQTTLDSLPLGIIMLATKGGAGLTGAGNTTSNTEARAFELQTVPLVAGKLYRISVAFHFQRTVADDLFLFRIRYTDNGTEATTASAMIGLTQQIFSNNEDVNFWYDFVPTTSGPHRMALTMQRSIGTGTGAIYLGAAERRFRWMIEDQGLAAGAIDPAALSQKLKQDGSGSDNPPVSQKVFTIQPTHTEFFFGFAGSNGNAYQTDDGDAAVGWPQDLLHSGNDRPNFSVFHFNHAAIVAALATATSIEKVELRFNVKQRDSSAGLDLSVFAHKYATFPWAMAGDYATEVAAARIVTGQGSRNDCASGSGYTIALNTAVGTNLKTGTYKGIGVTTTSFGADGVGILYGNPSSFRPTLIITYKSP